MDSKTFNERLDKINENLWKEVRELVQEAQADDGLDWDTNKEVSFSGDFNWQDKTDEIAFCAGWIYDRLNGRNRLHKKSITKKIRKALGYTRP